MYLVNRYSMVISLQCTNASIKSRLQCYVYLYIAAMLGMLYNVFQHLNISTVRKCIFRSVVRYKSTTYSYQYKYRILIKSENIKNIFEMLQKISETIIIY